MIIESTSGAKEDTLTVIKGTDFTVLDTLVNSIFKKIQASDTLRFSCDTERSQVNTTLVKHKSIYNVGYSGIARIKFSIKTSNINYASQGQIYFDGIAKGTLRSTTSATYVEFSEDLIIKPETNIELWISAGYISASCYTNNFRICFNEGGSILITTYDA